jgi:hypothetical protein
LRLLNADQWRVSILESGYPPPEFAMREHRRSSLGGLVVTAGVIGMLTGFGDPSAVAQDADPYAAFTPKESYLRGCGGCHTRESAVLRKIPRKSEPDRRAWIEQFMAAHPCECDPVKPKIVDYLISRTR